ncbi:hypothetical protein PIB30_110067, partial [Stylosanthes scabra]|nr:hypothetical protein [Stylosanthes scabra]
PPPQVVTVCEEHHRTLNLHQNRKAACGRHREEILSQLGELAKSEPLDNEQQYLQSGNMFMDPEHDFKTGIFPSYETKPCATLHPMFVMI